MPPFLLRDCSLADLDGLFAVAEYLDSVNLPHDRALLEQQIDRSQRSFSGALDVFSREYLFVLVDLDGPGGGRVIGTSMIHAQHGTRRAPHIFFDVMTDERYSETLDRHFVHQVLRIGYNYNGPTEIGGLILQPAYRGHEMSLGKWLSYVRFLYIARHRERFRDEILSELLPPLQPDGTSLLWEHLGRHFTGLSYQEADRISKTNKEFIRTLFPAEPIYTCLLPPEVRQLIGQVGPSARGVEKMLRRIGFQYAGRIDPFDGGPHFTARTDSITLLRQAVRARVMAVDSADEGRPFGLVCVERDRSPFFCAVGTRYRLEGDQVGLPEPTRRILGVHPGDEVGILPL
ncbi:MAG: arginine N-succinyltransferase [Myxococcales bacterium]|nr:arginine N-succinyltransferase [Myxococcota bacterium]MDW8282586.1 arginine N-succinyltransferase [Myxococcales bacterium]